MLSWYSGLSRWRDTERAKGGGGQEGKQEKGKRTSEIKNRKNESEREKHAHEHAVGGRQEDVAFTPEEIDRHTPEHAKHTKHNKKKNMRKSGLSWSSSHLHMSKKKGNNNQCLHSLLYPKRERNEKANPQAE